MSFTPIFYLCTACPTTEKTIEMVDKYVEHGARAFQLDMPSKNPYSETEFVKKMMVNTLKEAHDYGLYMDAICTIRQRHSDIEIHIVVYNDVLDSIGLDTFVSFYKKVGALSLMVPGISDENLKYLTEQGISIFASIHHERIDEDVETAMQSSADTYICLRNKKPGEVDKPGYDTWEKKYNYIRDKGIKGKVYSVYGIKKPEELEVIKILELREQSLATY